MVASIVAPLILTVLVMILLLLSAAAVVGLLGWRALRRRWRVLRTRLAGGGVAALWAIGTVGTARRRVRPSHAEVYSWSPLRARREMWRAVDVAESAVRVADVAGAPVAELPSLCRRLHGVAADLDSVLRVEPAHSGGDSGANHVRAQVAAVIDAATEVQRAAVTSANDAHAPRVRALTRDALDEVDCLAAGLDRSSGPFTRPPY